MVASGGAIVGLYPARVGEVEWSKKIRGYMEKYVLTRPSRPTMRP